MPCDIVTVTAPAPDFSITSFSVSADADNTATMTYYVSNNGSADGTVTIERTAVGGGVNLSDTEDITLTAGGSTFRSFEYTFNFEQNTDVEFCADII